MLRVLIGRLGGALAAVVGASIVSFLLLRLLPGNPARLILGPLASPQAIHAQTVAMGLDQPVYVQYWRYVTSFLRGDWGFSYTLGQPVTTAIATRLPATVELGLYAFVIALVGALLLGLVSTYRRRPAVDAGVQTVAFLGLGTPPFWFALIVLLLFSSTAHWLPGPEGRLSSGIPAPPTVTGLYTIDAMLSGEWGTFANALLHLVLPAVTLALAPFAYLVRLLRANLLEVSRELFITVSRSKGLSRWSAFARHALPNALLPTLTASGLLLAQLLAGSVLVERVFDWPGVGALVVDSILRQDYAVVQTFILLSAVAYVAVNLVVDVLYGVIDPRVRSAGAGA